MHVLIVGYRIIVCYACVESWLLKNCVCHACVESWLLNNFYVLLIVGY